MARADVEEILLCETPDCPLAKNCYRYVGDKSFPGMFYSGKRGALFNWHLDDDQSVYCYGFIGMDTSPAIIGIHIT